MPPPSAIMRVRGFVAHIDPDMLELYALGRLAESDLAPVEEHLLVCPRCQDRLQGIDHDLALLKLALTSPPPDSVLE